METKSVTKLIETHTHPVGATPMSENLKGKVKTLADKISLRSKYPELYRDRITQPPIDISDALIKDMDRHGVSHAIIQQDYGRASNELVAETVRRHPSRFFGLVSPHRWIDMGTHLPTEEELPFYRARAAEEITKGIEQLGLIGVGEFLARAFTTETHPEKIARDMAPIMDVVAKYKVPIQILTAWTQFAHNLCYGDPIWTDEIAGSYPDVPVILTKMGRGLSLFDNALMVALRNKNVYFDIVDTTPEHIRRAVDMIGADRLMFGTDWCCITRWVTEPADCYTRHKDLLNKAGLTKIQREQIEWRTAAEVFQLKLV